MKRIFENFKPEVRENHEKSSAHRETYSPRVEDNHRFEDIRLQERIRTACERHGLREVPGFKRIEKYNITDMGQKKALRELPFCNPNYDLGRRWKINCQRCVPTLEMRMRGYDVTAKESPMFRNLDDLAYKPFDVWENPEVISCKGNGLEDIKNHMGNWGNGSRAQIVMKWKNTNSGHTFMAENVNGDIRFIDPQNNNKDVSKYFNFVEPGSVQICRTDNKNVTKKIYDCCSNRS